MGKHLTYFRVENFKKFDSLEVKDIGQFNLITGDNNVGKTCLLEALLVDERFKTTISYFSKLLEKRNLKNNIFSHYNELDGEHNFKINEIALYQKNINKAINFNCNEIFITIENKKIRLKNNSTGELKRFIEDVGLFDYSEINHNSQNWIFFYVNGKINFLADITSGYYDDFLKDQTVVPAVMLNDKIENYIHETYNLIYKELGVGEKAIHTLNLFFSNVGVLDIRLFNETEAASPIFKNEVFIKTKSKKEYHNIREYGEGFVRCLHLIYLVLANKGNRIVIDEIEIGVHHSRQKYIWILLFNLCSELEVQIFATTHSKECAEAFFEAAKDLNNDAIQNKLRLIELYETKEKKIFASTIKGIDNIEYSVKYEPFRGENIYV